jgi:hypothetical protein
VPVTDFWGWTAPQLLTALTSAQNDLAAGSSIVSAGAGDISSARMVTNNARQRIRDIQMALYGLDPVTYVAFASIGQNKVIARMS